MSDNLYIVSVITLILCTVALVSFFVKLISNDMRKDKTNTHSVLHQPNSSVRITRHA